MNCEQFLRNLEFAGLESRERDHIAGSAFRLHESECAECAARAVEMRRFDAMVHRRMHAVDVPVRGATRVTRKLKGKFRRRVAHVLSLAASLLCAVGIGYAWRDYRIVPPADMPVEIRDPRAGFERWAEDNTFAPAGVRFNASMFSSAGPVEIRPGLKVPCATLRDADANATAQIYVVNLEDMPLEELHALEPRTPLFHSRIIRDRDRDDIHYLVVYTGPTLDAFLMPAVDDI